MFRRRVGARPAEISKHDGVASRSAVAAGRSFRDGTGFLMMAALSMAAVHTRNAVAIKNMLAGAVNGSAVLIFVTLPQLQWALAC